MKKHTSILFSGSLLLANAFALSAQMPFKPSTEKKQYWYQVVSAASNDYCKGKIIMLNGDQLKYEEPVMDPTNLWCFEAITDSTFAMKNYASQKYMGKSVQDGLVNDAVPVLIKKLADTDQYAL
ncbi:MAG: hypothetical protein ACRCXN_03230, partial [Bacteroidales bacterium]